MAKWFKVQDTLYNSDELVSIQDPVLMHGTPSYWMITYQSKQVSACSWTFATELECKSIHKYLTKVLTGSFKFLE